MRLVQTRNAEFFVPMMAGKRGPKFCRRMKTLAASTLSLIRIIRTSYSHRSGKRAGSHGFSPAAVPAAGFSRQKKNGSHGRGAGGKGFLEGISGKKGSRGWGAGSNTAI